MKDPIPLTNEKILENISSITMEFCREFKIPEYATREFKSFPLPARFLIMAIILNTVSKQSDNDQAKKLIEKIDNCYLTARLFLGEADDQSLDAYYDYWCDKAKKWVDSFRFNETCH